MSTDGLTEITDADIKSFLETAPLYSSRRFKLPLPPRNDLRIEAIDSHCEICDRLRPFHDMTSRGGGSGTASKVTGAMLIAPHLRTSRYSFSFSCVTCKKSVITYMLEQIVDDETVTLQKYGQLPRGGIPRDKMLQKFFKDDRDNYEKAVICLSHEYGVAAFAYFRRIVENNINRLLDLLQEDLQSSGGGQENFTAIQSLRDASPMSEKIKIANLALPGHLQPDGLNPLGKLYQVLSEGVHTLPEEECLKKARATSECLAFLVSELASRKEHRARFKSIIGQL
jgi:hypothetical protein